jgi:hypothetical protein
MSLLRTLAGADFLDELEAAFPGILRRAADAWEATRGEGYPRDVWICRQLQGLAELRGCDLTANIVRHALDRHGLTRKRQASAPEDRLREIVREELQAVLAPVLREIQERAA